MTRPLVQVLDWLEDELELGEYRREFARAKVDGALLLNLEVCLTPEDRIQQYTRFSAEKWLNLCSLGRVSPPQTARCTRN